MEPAPAPAPSVSVTVRAIVWLPALRITVGLTPVAISLPLSDHK